MAPLAVCSEGEDAILFLLMLSYAWKDPSVDSQEVSAVWNFIPGEAAHH